MRPEVEVRAADFSVAQEYEALRGVGASTGACVLFTGLVRDLADVPGLHAMELEHYPGMTEKSIEAIVRQARSRWDIIDVTVVHRVGRLEPSDQIVLVVVAGAHRGDAFAACEFVMDYLKTRAPFWKKEQTGKGARWVESRQSDEQAAARWRHGASNEEKT